jgi:hypothetical protein
MPVSETCVRSTLASGVGAGWPHDAAFSAFVLTSPFTIQLLVHLGISTLAAASNLTLRVAFYVLLKLPVVLGSLYRGGCRGTQRKCFY